MTRQTAQTLRARAHELRRLAIEIERSPVLGLDQYAGDETWRGDRPHLCVALLRTQLARLRDSVDDLRWRASRCEQQAVELDHFTNVELTNVELTNVETGHVR